MAGGLFFYSGWMKGTNVGRGDREFGSGVIGGAQTDFIRTFRDTSQRSQLISKRGDAEQLTVQGDRHQQGHD